MWGYEVEAGDRSSIEEESIGDNGCFSLMFLLLSLYCKLTPSGLCMTAQITRGWSRLSPLSARDQYHWRGVLLDLSAGLGITCCWLTPLFESYCLSVVLSVVYLRLQSCCLQIMKENISKGVCCFKERVLARLHQSLISTLPEIA